jgi:putative aldouronate transport system substrate-binding protein
MKKFLKLLLFAFAITALFAFTACRSDDGGGAGNGGAGGGGAQPPIDIPEGDVAVVIEGDARLHAHGLEIVSIDGEDVLRFTNTRNITVGAWNRSPDRMPHISESYWADWIRAEMLRLHNVQVEFIEIPRWEEVQFMAQLLAIGEAPDVAFTFEYATVQALADMDGIMDLAPLVVSYRDLMPSFYNLQGPDNIWWNRDPQVGTLWAFAGRHYASDLRIATFVREDWLEALGLDRPTTLQEFEDMLIAFRDNATLLLGDDAAHMIPFQPTQDVTWTADPVITSFIPHDITDREWYVYGFDDRRFTMPGIKEGIRVLNRWYNEGLIWRDFSLHDANDPIAADLLMLGFVGSFSGNWDIAFRAQPGLITNLQENAGPQARLVPVASFPNDAGEIRFQVPHGTDRSVFFPATNTEPVASLLYLDFVSRPEVREFLMFGEYGIHYERDADGGLVHIPPEDIPDNWIFPVIRNFDLLPTFNGVPPLNNPEYATLAHTFPGVDPQVVMETIDIGLRYAWVGPRAVTRMVLAEAQFGGGLSDIRDAAVNQAIVAPIADFDRVFDAGMENYMASGGRAIIDERHIAWVETFGDTDWLPH